MRDALLRTVAFDAPNGKRYRLRPGNELATLIVRCVCLRAQAAAAVPPRQRPRPACLFMAPVGRSAPRSPRHPRLPRHPSYTPTRTDIHCLSHAHVHTASYTPTCTRSPRGWHMEERHLLIDGAPCSASLFDFGVFFFNSAR